MNKTEQGVLQQSKLASWLIHILLLLSFLLTLRAYAETTSADALSVETEQHRHNVYIIYSPENTLHSEIVRNISVHLKPKHHDLIVSAVTPDEKIETVNDSTDIIIGIGHEGMRSADRDYPNTRKLFISTDPNKYRLDPDKNKHDAILYMSQPYCRQIEFIKLINKQWKTISVINSKKKSIDRKALRQCANKIGLKIYNVSVSSDEERLTDKIKHALHHSDVLLALPDSNIYNSKTVKNILLTSYRHRKPVIAFSKNFVNAGALASIYSNTQQIAQSASKLIEQYFDSERRFIKSINHPDTFNLDINRQVFKALDLSIPDVGKLRTALEQSELDNTGDQQ